MVVRLIIGAQCSERLRKCLVGWRVTQQQAALGKLLFEALTAESDGRREQQDQKRSFHRMRVATPNDLKLSEPRGWRDRGAVGERRRPEAAGVTAARVRCSAWLAVSFDSERRNDVLSSLLKLCIGNQLLGTEIIQLAEALFD